MNIYTEVSNIKGVGPKATERLNKAGIFSVLDLLLYFPRDYEFINGNSSIKEIDENEKQILSCTMVRAKGDFRTKTGKIITNIEFNYNGISIIGKWFNQPYIKTKFRKGETYNLLGKYKKVGHTLEITNPQIGSNESLKSEIIPKYSLKGELTNNFLAKVVGQVLDTITVTENLPLDILKKYNLISLDESIREIHFPKGKDKLERAIERLKFQELFTYSMKLLMLKQKIRIKNGIGYNWTDELNDLRESLPYSLTNAQAKVVRSILKDQKSLYPMNRLVQGDVGSGKTIVALIAIFNAYKNGYKSAFMAPTEILANQHYKEAKNIFEGFNIEIELLTGSTSMKEKKRIKERIKEEGPLLVIGTHALIQEDVEFNNLGLAVTDEQHRFGVEQRSRLINKGKRADVLVMTATPIPRTLALYVYSDLDVSAIDELPPGRKKIDTRFFKDDERDSAYKLALSEINKGRQVYIVCPLIEEDEKEQLNSVESVYEKLNYGIFKDIKVEYLHGKMKGVEKDEIINRFKSGDTKVLISTTVIEVGVNVPNASVMIVENAERFGLAQLHQLRGRVGRGEYESYCILIAKAKSETTKRRMEILTESTDGFYISEQDLKLRGSGEMFGMRQSGDEGLLLADLYNDMKILIKAREEANNILLNETEKNKILIREIKSNLEKSSKYICFN
ncbi:ATP-dependent DNA helicase RecG [Clostridium sardiniense]|uniref:ATP-dependent DNA helicase RecG n=1 Tax=Clostridium sardiniense TaxID=29369 RepID=UPI0019579F8B|nr:ATP-dependent DNA helicase RecG [Clostridium sardiniense]MBM7835124.1 ATP-dependent DNA helicase RecG [Clostridium sardiniense]